MSRTIEIDRGTVVANDTVLYREIRGEGPPLLLIVGATGDSGWYSAAADLLADRYTVVTYDRRGNSRSPAPPAWETTSMDEQADDAAALLRTLGLAPATVFGSSSGAAILVNMILRHPDVLRSAIVHEPPFAGVVHDPEAMDAELTAVVGPAMAEGGPRAAVEAFIRAVASDELFEGADPVLRERAMGNAPLVFGIEMPALMPYQPDAAALAATAVPVHVAAGLGSKEHPLVRYLYEAAEWTARTLSVPLTEISGAHVPYFEHPAIFAEELGRLLDGTTEE